MSLPLPDLEKRVAYWRHETKHYGDEVEMLQQMIAEKEKKFEAAMRQLRAYQRKLNNQKP